MILVLPGCRLQDRWIAASFRGFLAMDRAISLEFCQLFNFAVSVGDCMLGTSSVFIVCLPSLVVCGGHNNLFPAISSGCKICALLQAAEHFCGLIDCLFQGEGLTRG